MHIFALALCLLAAPLVQVDAWPAGDRWDADGYRRAVRVLMARAVAQGPLPRLEEGPARPEFLRFLVPQVDPAHAHDLRHLLGLAKSIERAQRIYATAMQRDPSYAKEMGALMSVESRLIPGIAALLNRPAFAALRPEALRVVQGSLISVASITYDPTLKDSNARPLADRLAELIPAALDVLPPACRREALVRLSLASGPPARLPPPLRAALERIRQGGIVKLPPALDRQIRRGMPAPERAWSVDDVTSALEALKACERADLPRLDDPVTGPALRRMIDTDQLAWLDDEEFPAGDRELFASHLLGHYNAARSVYVPIIEAIDEPRPDCAVEELGFNGALITVLRRMALLEERLEAGFDRKDPSTYLKMLGLAASRRFRPALLTSLISSAAPLAGAHPEARARFLELAAQVLPDLLPRLDFEARVSVTAAVHLLDPAHAPPAVARAYARLLGAITPPASPPPQTPPPTAR